MKVLTLSIRERIFIDELFSKNKDTYTEAEVQALLLSKFLITPEERLDINLQIQGASVIWNSQKGIDKEYELQDFETAYIKESAITLSKERGVTQNIRTVVGKIFCL